MATKDYIEASATPVTPMRGAHRGDFRGVTRRRQPVVNRGANPAARDWWFAAPFMPGDQQYHALARGDGALEGIIDRRPGAVKVMAVEVEGAVGADISRAEPLVP